MSLYYEAAKVVEELGRQGGSLKSIVYSGRATRSSPAQLYALVSESSKWSPELSQVIERAGLLSQEKKVPAVCLGWIHSVPDVGSY